MTLLPRAFFNRPAPQVARDLLGCTLAHASQGVTTSAVITETEAYYGEEDLACHAKAGKTPRTRVMYGPPGFAYIYFNYGVHWLFNVVTGAEDDPAAVLVRAGWPLEGVDAMAQRRPTGALAPGWLDGPAKLTQALGITGAQNGLDLCDDASPLTLRPGPAVPDGQVRVGPRVGIKVPEPWLSIPWRYRVDPAYWSALSNGGKA